MFDPKTTTLKELQDAPFWPFLSNGDHWLTKIEEALAASTPYQLEQDNFALQGENKISLSIIAEQEVKIKRLELLVERYQKAVSTMHSRLENIFSLGCLTIKGGIDEHI